MPAPRVKRPERERRLAAALAVVSGLLCALVASPAVAAPADGGPIAPWKAAEQVRASLFDAQTALLLDQAPEASVGAAREAFERGLERELERTDPRAAADARAALARAATALAGGDETGLAAARGSLVAALRRGAYAATLEAVEASDVATARRWILVRDFRQATRYTRPGVDATAALDALEAGEIAPGAAALQVRKDLLDAYQARLGDYLAEAEREAERGFGPALAESAALVRGYWLILAEEYLEQRGGPAEREADRAFVDLVDAAGDADPGRFAAATQAVEKRLDGFTAAPFTAEEQARRAAQLTRFVDLIPVEYDHGTEDGRVTIPFELQEMLAFIDAADSALTDLEGELDERDPEAAASVERDLERLRTIANDANEGRSVAALEQVEALEGEVSGTLDAVFPEEWKQSTDEADYDLVDISLDQMEAAISAGEYEQAEQARLSAYALFEFGPEIKLKAFDPQLVAEIEGMVWYGARGVDGLAEMIAAGADLRQIRETRLELDEALDEARAKTGDGASDATVITNAATIVFREGLEAILIVAAVTASMVGANRRLRRPVYRGALLALPASVLLFIVSMLVLDSLSQYGERLEAVVGVVAIGVLMLVMNWFFHRVYWTEWISSHRKRGLRLSGGTAAAAGAGAVTVVGLYLLGFSSVLREGFETVLFLQALQLSSGTGIVVAGVGFGLLATAMVGIATFMLERRLPYKRMLIVTGVLIALVLVVLVGNTVRTMQGVGWIPITPVEVEFPLWMGTWLGVFPTVETLVAQGAAFVFVIGSYFAAEWWRKRRLRRAIAEYRDGEAAAPEPAPAPVGAAAANGNGAGEAAGRQPEPTHANGGGPVGSNGSARDSERLRDPAAR